jgi:hypothetical protein
MLCLMSVVGWQGMRSAVQCRAVRGRIAGRLRAVHIVLSPGANLLPHLYGRTRNDLVELLTCVWVQRLQEGERRSGVFALFKRVRIF